MPARMGPAKEVVRSLVAAIFIETETTPCDECCECMVRRLNARGLNGRKYSLRKMYPASGWRCCSPGHDDDARVLVLLNQSATGSHFTTHVSGTPFDCSFVVFSSRALGFSQDLGKTILCIAIGMLYTGPVGMSRKNKVAEIEFCARRSSLESTLNLNSSNVE